MTDLVSEHFGSPHQRVLRAIEALRAGQGVLLLDDPGRENEGDLIYSAQHLSVEQMARLIRDCSGIVCLCLDAERVKQLALPPMVVANSSRNGTAFTVSIEARDGVTTGVSAADRVETVRTACAPDAQPDDLLRPGHVFPLRAAPGGLSERRGHTEGTLALMVLAGLEPAGVLCELCLPDGRMARTPDVVRYGLAHEIPVLTIDDLVQYELTARYRPTA
ncbi:MAG: 3,4-dihydroxy-2-butanone-4-phosphate synthase [Pseudomonadota bacterium]